ncbi:MAG: hypothetical protein CUN52_06310 [Phototrophicales bacterium]|nr:MAG: hypothetical protein CUN52_06310 [Phototrophicales bacterium]
MSQPSGMITCINCGHLNRVGIIFCEKCGASLNSIPISYQTNVLSKEASEKLEEQSSDTVKVSDTDDVQGSASLFHPNMELMLEIEGISNIIKLQPKEGHEYVIGRHDPEGGFLPEIDLLPFGGYRMGISRRHASIRLIGKQLNIRDLGSSNGTSVNGNKLDKHENHQLRDGDKLRMGSMTFRVRFIS